LPFTPADGRHPAADFFGTSARVALVRYDSPIDATFAEGVVKPRLAAHGLKVSDEAIISQPSSASEAGDTTAQISDAVLRFRTEGIDHVLFVPTGGVLPFLWMPAAQAQGYAPRYALNSLDIPRFIAGNAPQQQLHGALGIGWMPPCRELGG